MHIYIVDENGKFHRYADVDGGIVCFQAEEILCMETGEQAGYYRFYSHEELMKKAEKVLDGRELTDEERRKYFIEN